VLKNIRVDNRTETLTAEITQAGDLDGVATTG
jgi:hypothetical protein